jgi:glycosyltransferase involved in cell wall biosynthesis
MLAPMACPPNLQLAAAARAQGRDAILRAFELPADRNYLGCFAQFRPVKRQDLLIQAFTSIAAEFPRWELLLAGAGECVEQCRQLASALPGRIHFLGSIPHERAIALMAVMDAVAHCSTVETFGYSMLEPLLLGVPTVMSRVGVAAEIERAGKAVVVDPASAPALADGLRTVLRRDERIRAMAEQAPQWVTQTFDTPLVAAKLLDLYERMLANRSPQRYPENT